MGSCYKCKEPTLNGCICEKCYYQRHPQIKVRPEIKVE